MLQFIRSKAGSFVFKILFVVLIASFGIWGIGDFLRQRPQDGTVISVGDRKVTGDELRREVQRVLERYRGSITLEQAKMLGIVQQSVDHEVQTLLFEQEANRQHILISDDQLRDAVQRERAFQGTDGKFDRAKFFSVLAENGLSQTAYEASLRKSLPEQLLAGPLIDGVVAPASLTDLLYRFDGEQRIADWVYLPNAGAKDVTAPDDKALHDWYDQHHDAYTAPEFRSFILLPMQDQDVAGAVTITDDELQAAYQDHLKDYTTEEKRHVLQMLLHDEKSADAAAQALAAGKDFFEVAKDIAKQDKDAVDLGTLERKDLPAAIAETAFAAKQGETTKPIKGPFGWSILRITGIEPGGVKPFAEVKATLEADLRKTKEGEVLYDLANKQVQDALSAGSEPQQIAEQLNLKTVTIAAADREGKGPDGKPVPGLVLPVDQVMATVFETARDQVSSLKEIGQGSAYFVVKVTGITPSALTPFEEVKARVKDDWTADQKARKIADQAKTLADSIKPGATLAQLAAAQKLQVATTPAFTRSNPRRDLALPPGLVSKLFALKPGEAATEPGPQGVYVAQLKEVKPADPATDKVGVERLATELAQGLTGDLAQQFEGALKQRYPVEIRQAAIDQLFAATPE